MPWRPTPPRPASDWKGLAFGTILVSFWLGVSVWLHNRGLALTFLVGLGPMAFVSGYLYRADLTRRQVVPRVRLLRVIGDDQSANEDPEDDG
jgi:hypothetical protein